MKIDKIYVINLLRDNDHIVEKLNTITNMKVVVSSLYLDAIDGWKIASSEEYVDDFKVADWWKIDHEHNFYNREVTPGEMGCGLSHYECVRIGL